MQIFEPEKEKWIQHLWQSSRTTSYPLVLELKLLAPTLMTAKRGNVEETGLWCLLVASFLHGSTGFDSLIHPTVLRVHSSRLNIPVG